MSKQEHKVSKMPTAQVMAMELESASLRQDSKDSCEDDLRWSMGGDKLSRFDRRKLRLGYSWNLKYRRPPPPPAKTHDGSLGPQLALMADGRTFKMRSLEMRTQKAFFISV